MLDIPHFEPGDRDKYSPLEVMKLAAFYRLCGDRVTFHKHRRGSLPQRRYCRAYVTSLVSFEWTRTTTRRRPSVCRGRAQNSQDGEAQCRRHHASSTESALHPACVSWPPSELGGLVPPRFGDKDATEGRCVSHDNKERTLQHLDKTTKRLECEAERRTRLGAEKEKPLEQREETEKNRKEVCKLPRTTTDNVSAQLSKQACKILQTVFEVLKDELPEKQFNEIREKIHAALKPGKKTRD